MSDFAKTKEEKTNIKEVQLVVFRLADEEFGVDVNQIREIIRMQEITTMPKAPEFVEGVINLRGSIIAVMDLAKRFGLEGKSDTEKGRIIVAEIENNYVGMIVDEVPEVIRINEDRVEPTPEMFESSVDSKFIKGIGKFNDRLIIILNVDKILSVEEITKLGRKEG